MWLLASDPPEESEELFERVLRFPKATKRFAPLRNVDFIKKLNRKYSPFEAVIFIYTDPVGINHSNMRLLACQLETLDIYAINNRNEWNKVDREDFVWDLMEEFELTYPAIAYRFFGKFIKSYRKQLNITINRPPKRFTVVTNSLTSGGVELLLYHQIKALTDQGYEVQLLAGSGGLLYSWFENLPIDLHVHHKEESEFDVVTLRLVPWLVACMSRFNPDALMVYHTLPFVPALLAGTICQVPLILRSENSVVTTGYMGKRNDMRTKALGDCYDGTFAVSRAVAASLNRSVRDQCAIIPGTIAKPEHYIGIEPVKIDTDTTIRFLTVARLSKEKGIEILLDAATEVLKDFRNIEFHLVGDGGLRNQLETKISELGLTAHIHLHGFQENVPEHLSRSHVFILPSFHEGLPMAVIEAMMAGRPVIATEISGITELIDSNTGWLVKPGDPEELANMIREVLRAPEVIRCRGEQAREKARREFTFHVMMDKLIRFIHLEWEKRFGNYSNKPSEGVKPHVTDH